MSFLLHPALQCPIDQNPLQEQANCLVCENGHSFDIASQGYVNLLAAHDKRSRDPGDGKEMIKARRDFLNRGYYQPIAEQLNNIVQPLLSENSLVVDAGCGEGYYLMQLAQHLAEAEAPKASMLGFDISKWALRAAARRFSATWLVASNRQIPLAEHSADVVLSLFGFPDYPAFQRILKPGGTLILVNPGPNHLLELRKIIYPEIRHKPSGRGEAAVYAGFSRPQRSELSFAIDAMDGESIKELLAMTPHMFRADSAGKHRAGQLSELSLTVDVEFELFTAKNRSPDTVDQGVEAES